MWARKWLKVHCFRGEHINLHKMAKVSSGGSPRFCWSAVMTLESRRRRCLDKDGKRMSHQPRGCVMWLQPRNPILCLFSQNSRLRTPPRRARQKSLIWVLWLTFYLSDRAPWLGHRVWELLSLSSLHCGPCNGSRSSSPEVISSTHKTSSAICHGYGLQWPVF